ncbi:MAG: helix-turn-helix transcriptional regulator [Lysinibacillus sp.]|nr:helix-turn-helix transcriptional regulator [Lysinibacillus sp.]
MIKCNLAVLLAERNMKISELSKRTGISRTTLTALAQNQSKGIQFDTFDTLCNYLKITPNDLFIQERFEYDFSVTQISEEEIEISASTINVIVQAEIVYKNNHFEKQFPCEVTLYQNGIDIEKISIAPRYPDEIFDVLISIPVTFKTSFEEELAECIKSEIIVKYNLEYEDIETHVW